MDTIFSTEPGQVKFNASELSNASGPRAGSSGMYLYRLTDGDFVMLKKMLLFG